MGSAMLQGLPWGRAAQDWAELQEPVAAPLWDVLLDAASVGMNNCEPSLPSLPAPSAYACDRVPDTFWPCPALTTAAEQRKEVSVLT